MFRISMVGGAMSNHGQNFGRIYNGCDPEVWKTFGLGGKPDATMRIENARVVKVWDPNRGDAEKLAKICKIETVCDDIEEAATGVDAIIIPDDMSCHHYKFAEPLWKAGLPIYIDKQLAITIEEAEHVVAQAKKHNVLIFSASGLQYTKEIGEARPEVEKLGNTLVALAASPNELIFYGIHGLAMLYDFFGPGIESVQNTGEGDVDIVKYRWKDGRIGMHFGLEKGRPGWRLVVYGEKGKLDINIADVKYFYWNIHKHFVEMIETRKPPLPYENLVEIIRALVRAKESKKAGGKVIRL